jgi:hypothetical protein
MPGRPAASNIDGVNDLDNRRWGWWGFVFTAAFVASLVAGGALAVGKTLYLPGASAAQLRDFYSTNELAVSVQSGLQALAALALLLFGHRLRTFGRAAYGGAIAAAVFALPALLGQAGPPTESTATNLAIAPAVAVTTYTVIVALSVLKLWGRIRH